jgi:CRP-like cAMP-binding protein
MTREQLLDILGKHPFTGGFSPSHIEKLAGMATETEFARNDLIFREGDPSDAFYLILEGNVALDVSAAGRTIRVATVSAGEELGWSSLTPDHAKHFGARTLGPVRALAFDGALLLRACDEDNGFGYVVTRALLRVVARRLHATRIQLLDVYTPAGGAKSMKV